MWNILCNGLLLICQIFRGTVTALFLKTDVDHIGSLKMNLDLVRDLPFKDGGNQIHFEKVVNREEFITYT